MKSQTSESLDANPDAGPFGSLEWDASEVRPKPMAVTVKLDMTRYEQIKIYGLKTRKSNQEILVAALDLFLKDKSS